MVGENDYQPEELLDGLVEENHMLKVNYPNVIPLMLSKEKLKYGKSPAVLKCHIPNRRNYPEVYCHSILILFFSFRNDGELKDGHP